MNNQLGLVVAMTTYVHDALRMLIALGIIALLAQGLTLACYWEAAWHARHPQGLLA